MARRFTAANAQYITLSGGQFASQAWTYGTVVFLIRRASAPAAYCNVCDQTNGTSGVGLVVEFDTSQNIYCTYDGATTTSRSITAISNTTDWFLIGITKATGSVKPRYHIKNVSTGAAWVHEDGDLAIANGTSTALGSVIIGSYGNLGDYSDSDLAALGWYRQWVPTDGEFEAWGFDTSYLPWTDVAVLADKAFVVLLDQGDSAMPLYDLVGQGAQTAVTASIPTVSDQSVPLLGYGAPVIKLGRVASGTVYNETALTFTIVGVTSETDNAVRLDSVTTTAISVTTETDVAVFADSITTTAVGVTSLVDARAGTESIADTWVASTTEVDARVMPESLSTTVVSVTTEADVAAFADTDSFTVVTSTSEVDARAGAESLTDVWVAVTSSTLSWTGLESVGLTVVATTSDTDVVAFADSVVTTVIALLTESDSQAMVQSSSDVAAVVTSVADVAVWTDADSFVINAVTSVTDSQPGGPESVSFTVVAVTSAVDFLAASELVSGTVVSSTSVVDGRVLTEGPSITVVAPTSSTDALVALSAALVTIVCLPGVSETLAGTVSVSFTILETDGVTDVLVSLNTPRGHFSATGTVSSFGRVSGSRVVEEEEAVRLAESGGASRLFSG